MRCCWLIYHPHKRSHMVHHTRCNTDEDPDIYARGPFGTVAFWQIPVTALGQMNPFALRRDCQQFNVPVRERYIAYATFAAYVVAAAAIIATGHGVELLVLWFIPWLVGYSTMLIFTWVPHHAHVETGRYRNTRCSIWPWANYLTQGQHMHIHPSHDAVDTHIISMSRSFTTSVPILNRTMQRSMAFGRAASPRWQKRENQCRGYPAP